MRPLSGTLHQHLVTGSLFVAALAIIVIVDIDFIRAARGILPQAHYGNAFPPRRITDPFFSHQVRWMGCGVGVMLATVGVMRLRASRPNGVEPERKGQDGPFGAVDMIRSVSLFPLPLFAAWLIDRGLHFLPWSYRGNFFWNGAYSLGLGYARPPWHQYLNLGIIGFAVVASACVLAPKFKTEVAWLWVGALAVYVHSVVDPELLPGVPVALAFWGGSLSAAILLSSSRVRGEIEKRVQHAASTFRVS